MNAAAMVPIDNSAIPTKPAIVTQNTPSKAKTIKEQVEDYFSDIPMLVKVAECESRFHQYNADGDVFRGVVPTDVGVMQINEKYWGETANKLGIDLYTTQGNMQYARYLYLKEGLRPWKSSSACWTKGQELALNK
jgi:hypothetical protein